MNTDTSNVEAFQWGEPLPIADTIFYSHPDLDILDVYLEWLYGDLKGEDR